MATTMQEYKSHQRMYHIASQSCLDSYLDMFEFKHVSLNKGAPDLLVSPCDEQLVVVISLTIEGR